MDKDLKFWDRVSKLYTFFQEKQNKYAYLRVSELSEQYCKNKDVLELASGTGQITKYLSKVSKSYLATDYSKKMIEQLEKRNIANINLEVADATKLNYLDNSFDTVIIANALHIMENPDLAIKEIKRVLKPNGILIAPTFVYDMKVNKVKLFMTKMFGFRTYHKWSLEELKDYIKNFGFDVLDKAHIKAKPAYMGLVILENKK